MGPGNDLLYKEITVVSSDERTTSITMDLDGDGEVDRSQITTVALDRSTNTIFADHDANGDVTVRVDAESSQNGLETTVSFDLNADGTDDIVRERSTAFDASGNRISILTETFGGGTVTYQEITTTSGDGLNSTTTIDFDGDGSIDGISGLSVELGTDGSRTTTEETIYADGELRSSYSIYESASGRLVTETHDYDGNGIADKVSTLEVRADGGTILTETSFGEGGMRGQRFITTTSADGLITEVVRSGNLQTITRSALDNGSYTWNNGVAPAIGATQIVTSHAVDGLGIETWASTKTWKEQQSTYNSRGDLISTTVVDVSTTAETRIDAATKAQIIADAQRIFDTVLDRDADFNEVERLVEFVSNGRLDKVALSTVLFGAGMFETNEYAARYGAMSDVEFITQTYLNSFGRAPSIDELDVQLETLLSGASSRIDLALSLADASEHLVVGNVHRITNNFDVIMNPAVFERSLDKAYVHALIENLVDVVYDRGATQNEIDYLSDLLLNGTDSVADISDRLLALDGDIQGISSSSLHGLTGLAFVEKAYWNALGRAPSNAELTTWNDHISAGHITVGEFVASLAQSVEHLATANSHEVGLPVAVESHVGTATNDTVVGTASAENALLGLDGADSLTGGALSDRFTGGGGADTLLGGAGNDSYVWSKGDGNDIINDLSISKLETDTLVLTDVASTEVQLSRAQGSNNLVVTISSPGGDETITIQNLFSDPTKGYGIEAISFGDGVVWSLDDILGHTRLDGTSAADTLSGKGHGDNIFGGDGNDTVDGNDGDDEITGGQGDDVLRGDDGADTYFWSRGDGNDTINDTGLSVTDIDRLVLTDVNSQDVVLSRALTGAHLLITINGPGGSEEITVQNRYYSISEGRGLEVIEFADGVVWTLEDILQQTSRAGTNSANALSGTAYIDVLQGLDGNDTIDGNAGDDIIVGGLGADVVRGDAGSDTYLWSRGDGNDVINETDISVTDIDTLYLQDVASSDVTLSRVTGSDDLIITIVGATSEVITVQNRYWGTARGYGIEAIKFADGAFWSLETILDRTVVNGTSSGDWLVGTAYLDNLFGLAGNDTLDGNAGDDVIVGGGGADIVRGDAGNDLYLWSKGDGNDSLSDTSSSLTDLDTLRLTDVSSVEAVLTQSGNNLLITVGSTGEQITVTNRFQSAGSGYGVEFIEFSDGVVVNVLDNPVAESIVNGTASGEVLAGWGFKDTIYGLDGNDTIDGNGDDDTIIGGLGNDTLRGDAGNDQYIWERGDGHDLLHDDGTSLTELDRLVLTDVASDEVTLTRAQGSNDLLITISGSGGAETITVKDRFNNPVKGYGLELIEFSDGVMWTLDEIIARTTLTGDASANSFTGTAYDDNIYGAGGNDTLAGHAGDDYLIGGVGDDLLWGGVAGNVQTENGNDIYVWSKGDGNDVLKDWGQSLAEADTLELVDVDSTDVALTRQSGSTDLVLTVVSNGEALVIDERYQNPSYGYGIERITFRDGVIWSLDDILERARVEGDAGANLLSGSSYADNLFGYSGNDTLTAGLGDDSLFGGGGDDVLWGGGNSTQTENGDDTFTWAAGDGNDLIKDWSQSTLETDTLVFVDVASSDVSLSRTSGNKDLFITVLSTGEVITVDERFQNTSYGYGVEVIKFSDGVIWDLDDILAHTRVDGTAAANTLVGTEYRDNIYGLDGNDVIDGNGGDDHIAGGRGVDTLRGDAGNDTYYWAMGDGNDTLNETATSKAEIDVLQFSDVLSGDVTLTRASGSSDLQITIDGSSGVETITVTSQFYSVNQGRGIESIVFADGEIWSFKDIEANTRVDGTSTNNNLAGTAFADHMFGLSGNDTLTGSNGDDVLNGGIGADSLNGGNDWDLASYATAVQGVYVDLSITVGQTGNVGGEEVGDILSNIEGLEGSAFDDTLIGNGAANTLIGSDGADELVGGAGSDSLSGGSGADTFVFGVGDGQDIILDFEDGLDLIEFRSTSLTFAELSISDEGFGARVQYGVGHSILLVGALAADLGSDDFLFS